MLTNVDIDYKEYAIGGKLLTAKVVFPESMMRINFSEESARQAIRQKLVEHLADAMLQNKLVEVTQIQSPTDLTTTLHARCYVAPDSTVKLLRTIVK